MTALHDPTRHERLGGQEWAAGRARDAIADICRDAEAAFDQHTLWPAHPRDLELGDQNVFRGLYLGAAGMAHGLHRLASAGFHSPAVDLAEVMEGLVETAQESPDLAGEAGSLLVGATGVLLVAHRLAESAPVADLLAEQIAANAEHPSNEVLLGSPGTMLAARAMHVRTGQRRFEKLWRDSARILVDRQEEDGLWTQDLYGERLRAVGAGHGFAGNIAALWQAPEWLDDPAGLEGRAMATARSLARVEGSVANWTVRDDGSSKSGAPPRVQWCHGAPGIVLSLSRLGPEDEHHGELLAAGGEMVWQAGPIAANAGLCHGTSGNGFAFLALLDRTRNELWLERARLFAMHALDQVARWREPEGRGRYSLFTGDLGPALLAAACFQGEAGFPGLTDL